jgi:PASTA domain
MTATWAAVKDLRENQVSVVIGGPTAGQVIRPGNQTVTGTATGQIFPPVAIQSVTVNGQSAVLTPIAGSLIVGFTATVPLPAWVPTATITATAVDEFGVRTDASITVRMGGGWVGGWSGLEADTSSESMAIFEVAANEDGRLEVFGIRPGMPTVWHTWQAQLGGPWVYWHELSTDDMVLLAVVRNADGRLEVCGLKPGRPTIWHTWQTQPGGPWAGSWSELYTDSDELGEIKAAANKDGRLEVFGPYNVGDFRHTWQTQPGGPWVGSWSELYSAGTTVPIEGSAVTANADGRLEVFGLYQGDLWHAAQTQPGTWDNGEWHTLGRPLDGLSLLGSVAAASNANGCLELFAVSGSETYADGTDIWHIAQTQPGSWDGSTWGQLPSLSDLAGNAVSILDFAVEQNGDGKLELVALTDQSNMFRTGQNKPGTWDGATWTGFYGNDGPITFLRMTRNADGRLEVFGINNSLSDLNSVGTIYHTWRDWDVPFEGTPTGTVPSVIGLSPDEASAAIQAAGFTFASTADPVVGTLMPRVESQNPEGGATGSLGSTVNVTIAEPVTGTVPDVLNLSPNAASAKIQAAGFAYSGSADPVVGKFKPYVEDQDPGGGATAPLGSTVNVTIAVPVTGPNR